MIGIRKNTGHITRVHDSLALIYAILPGTIGIVILRNRLWDIALNIHKTLQYALLIGVLALAYFGSLLQLQKTGETSIGEQLALAIVISTLGISALFNPLRIRVQNFIDRRFYRKKYDAEQTLARFAEVARDEVDMDKLTIALLSVVEESMHPESVSVWLQGPEVRS